VATILSFAMTLTHVTIEPNMKPPADQPCSKVRFRNGPEERGRVDHVLIDGRPVAGAAEMLDIRAARRLITSIEILDCGAEPRRPVFQGMINFEPMESRSLGMSGRSPSASSGRVATAGG
jgi:hypothetical protein